jgi:ATP-binding cassette subfamily B protein/subfamily B ATP-binding cassette protein MsbA
MRHFRLPKGGLSLVGLLMLLGVFLNILKPWPLKLLVDHVLVARPLPESASWLYALPGGDSPLALLAWLAVGTTLLFLAVRGLGMTQGYVQAGVGNRMVNSLAGEVFDHIQRLSLRFHTKHTAADLLRRITGDANCIRALVLGVLLPGITSAVNLALMFAIMWRLDRHLLLIALAALIPLGLVIKFFTGPMTDRTRRQQQLESEMLAVAEQTLTALPVVKAFNREEYEDQRYRDLSQHTLRAYLRAYGSQLQFKIGANTVTAIGTAAIMVVGGLHVLRGELSAGSLLVFLAYLSALYSPIETLVYGHTGVSSASIGGQRILEILESEDRVPELPGARPLPVLTSEAGRHLRIENVVFGYEPGRPVLTGVSFEALPNETVAIVGPTGAGKSTLVSLVPRFFDPWGGRVILGGHDVKSLPIKSLRSQISVVLQEPFLLPLTVAENISYGRPNASWTEIEAAARAANAHTFIERLPRGYETVIGERGATLSGGERQRLSIARALLKDAPLLILDEPTSALDALTEEHLLEAVERLMRGRTTLIIAHRLSTIRRADRIVVLSEGRVAETGTHNELVNTGGLYSQYHNIQFGQFAAVPG